MNCGGTVRNDPHHSNREAGGPRGCSVNATYYDPVADTWYCQHHKTPEAHKACAIDGCKEPRYVRPTPTVRQKDRAPSGSDLGQIPYCIDHNSMVSIYGAANVRAAFAAGTESELVARPKRARTAPDSIAEAVRRTRSDANDRGAADHDRRAGAVTNRQRPAMDRLGVEPGVPLEFKHAAVPASEYFAAVGVQLFRREMGLDEWPLVVEIESTLLRDVCTRYGIELQVMTEEAAA